MPTLEAVMTTKEVADRLSGLFKENKWAEAQEELFSQDAVSVEPPHAQGLQTVQGLDAIKKKGEDFNQMVEEMHGGWAGEPIVAGNYIAIPMGMDVTMKGAGRSKMDEIALYEVKDGKIVKEQFFY
ncbi:MAG TPA: nuclear transport factor 2 family protein [Chitinophagaceae bacterium]|nr:nuclear transport factor 2 family protein [Chitinophagaceae bacterium]